MSNIIQCNSCGGSNQLPEGRDSMFCAFCGGAVERKITERSNISNSFPRIISTKKREIPFKETEWYQDKSIEHNARMNLSTSSFYQMIKNIEHFRTNDGYNVIITYESKDSLGYFPKEHKETEFVPFEYDYDSYKSELNLDSMKIKSFNELLLHYDILEIEELKILSLNNNEIKNWDGIENFKRLEKLSIRNNMIENFPSTLPKEISEYDSNLAVVKFLDLRNNKISNIGEYAPVFDDAEILLDGNPLEFDSIPKQVKSCHTFKDDGREICWDFEMIIDDENKLIFQQKKNQKDISSVAPLISSEESKPAGKCFIATATMGSYDHPKVMELRDFRDNWILQKSWGQQFVKHYYYYGKKIATRIESNMFLKEVSYILIVKPLVVLSRILKK